VYALGQLLFAVRAVSKRIRTGKSARTWSDLCQLFYVNMDINNGAGGTCQVRHGSPFTYRNTRLLLLDINQVPNQ
jgi:hypothetical protein